MLTPREANALSLRELETYLHEHIPLSAAMQVSVLGATQEQVVLGAPLAPNINHRDTVFGGSASALAILSAWTLLHTKLVAAGIVSTLVIQRNTMSYDRPIAGPFAAQASAPPADAWQSFIRTLQRKGRARITVSSVLMQDGNVAGRFEGDFVALAASGRQAPAAGMAAPELERWPTRSFAHDNPKEQPMEFLSRCLALPVALLPALAFAEGPGGLSYFHHDWELACDNTGTCRAAGYHGDAEELGVSLLLTRRAGPNEPVTGQLMIGQYGDNPTLDNLPSVFRLFLRINGRPAGQVTVPKDSLVASLPPKQVAALLAALVRRSRIELTTGDNVWSLSDKGAAAVLLKMDEFQGRIGTPGALVRKGAKDEGAVPPPVPVPVVIAAALPKALPDDQLFARKNSKALTEALRAALGEDDCPGLAESEGEGAELTVTRLSDTKMLISAQCWMGAYNIGYGYWVVNPSPPYRPVLVTTSGSEHSAGTISASHKGRGLGDCWNSAAWTWDGRQFVHTEESSTGMCKLMAPGGAWSLPTIVTEVRPAAQGTR